MKINVNMDEATKKWKPIVEKLGVTDPEKVASMCEYAELHAGHISSGMIKENVGYSNPANTAGMGAVAFPTLTGIPGVPSITGSGDLGQTMLPGALKIAAQTIGLELVPTINVNSNVVDFLYFDWTYDDTNGFNADERSSTFKYRPTADADFTALKAFLRAEMVANNVTELRGRLSKPLYFHLSGGSMGAAVAAYDATVKPTGSLQGWVEFRGFSRLDEYVMFRVYTQDNTASTGSWTFSTALNTFPATGAITTLLSSALIDDTLTSAASFAAVAVASVAQVSLNEDNVDGFLTNGEKTGMTRGAWDTTQANKVGPNSKTARVEMGVAHVKASLRLSEVQDWKKMYGTDVVQKTQAQLVNLMSQKISIEIVEKIKEMALLNRSQAQAAPATMAAALATAGITDGKIFDYSVSAAAALLSGEHNASISRKIWAKVTSASYYILNDGRIGRADYLICSSTVIAALRSIEGYTINPMAAKFSVGGQLVPAGEVDGIKMYVDPYMQPGDLTIYLGRKGKADEPGIKFFAYLLAETVEITSEATMGPTLYMYSRFAIAEFGWFPHKQYMAIKVEDVNGVLY